MEIFIFKGYIVQVIYTLPQGKLCYIDIFN